MVNREAILITIQETKYWSQIGNKCLSVVLEAEIQLAR